MMVRIQAILTQLVFDHALRIRVKAETSDTPPSSTVTSTATTPDTASIADRSENANTPGGSFDGDSENETTGDTAAKKLVSTELSTSSTSTKVADKLNEPAAKGGNLVGRMTNLVTTDMNNIVEGRDFLFACEFLFSTIQNP